MAVFYPRQSVCIATGGLGQIQQLLEWSEQRLYGSLHRWQAWGCGGCRKAWCCLVCCWRSRGNGRSSYRRARGCSADGGIAHSRGLTGSVSHGGEYLGCGRRVGGKWCRGGGMSGRWCLGTDMRQYIRTAADYESHCSKPPYEKNEAWPELPYNAWL